MNLLNSYVADVRVIQIVGLLVIYSTIDKFTFFSIIDLLRLPDNEFVFADLEHGRHHEQTSVKIISCVSCIH